MTDSPSAIGPIRRAHRKSRTGCTACKARKIKCDEHHPSCINCISHGLQCPFLSMKANLPPRPRPQSQAPSPVTVTQSQFPSPSPISPHHRFEPSPPPPPPTQASIPINPAYLPGLSPEDDTDDPLPTLHLLLLHNFTSSTYLTLTTDPSVAAFWRTSVVNLAFALSSETPPSFYLLRVLLSVSALHLAFQQSCPKQRDFYTAQGILLHQKATREAMRRMLPTIERAEDELGLYLFANLTIYVALASPRGRRGDGRVYVLDQNERGSMGFEAAGLGPEAGMGMGMGGGGLGFPDWAFLVNGAKSLSNFILHNEKHREFLSPFLTYGGRRWREARGESASTSSSTAPSKAGTPTPSVAGSSSEAPPEAGRKGSSDGSVNGIPKPGPLSHLRELISRDTANPHLQTYLFAIDELELSLTHLTSSSPTSQSPAATTTASSPSITHFITPPPLTACAADDLTSHPPSTVTATSEPPQPGPGGDVLDAMLWLWAVSDSLVPLLKIPTQEAVAIFAHFGILLKHHERQWWLQGWGDHLILRAKDILDEEHRGWIEWPLRVLEGEGGRDG
ncbi:hypothetical protein B0T20DRAFT_114022 [Sordaria brevicollis]|uniref:Zn(2)-C6 fungal-type domain-containing protein n=1 Tax=Sordaria brevicollis TaxID=83679 RepID=A0AAE0PKT3_SORBR|nr:hypothetical protein B0T20DRAFT_114022 [Sordaria brevicollis]